MTVVKRGYLLFITLLLIAATSIAATSGSASGEIGTRPIELRITDHKAGIDNFSELHVSLSSVQIHATGAKRNEGWLTLINDTRLFDIVPLKDGRSELIGQIDIPIDDYDAVKIEFAELHSKLLSNSTANLSARDTTVATPIRFESSDTPVLMIDLYAEDQTDHEADRFVVKVKEIRFDE